MDKIFEALRERMTSFRPTPWEALPDLGLYMDQVITYIDRQLSDMRGESGEKPLTAAMVNNYVKVQLIPRPQGKKYSREHLAMLMMVCQLKRACPIEQIARLFALQLRSRDVRELYAEFCRLQQASLAEVGEALHQADTPAEQPADYALRLAVEAGTLCHVVQSLLSDAPREEEPSA